MKYERFVNEKSFKNQIGIHISLGQKKIFLKMTWRLIMDPLLPKGNNECLSHFLSKKNEEIKDDNFDLRYMHYFHIRKKNSLYSCLILPDLGKSASKTSATNDNWNYNPEKEY